ncbi:hypothetical protein AGR7C_Cc150082 [Agrobacterium deltaense Zutra 3/1]|uniref:Uncharacterized protein n=1 Tax=Agrobacterium deltaense Zutra 3/1 TaxID=1183427 RepID=A0A1S7PET8_9HYPH|nr:hypothetical protein [Agrobacterium deltaense]CUX20354.1 hypothetical protein AGR7C_Cc150082 [Agrobacterium deltaense Zutra 3/1]
MKTVIECMLGATEQTVGGITYSFDRDAHGRFVNEVNSVLHRSIFLNVQHYREVPLDPPPSEDEQEIPAFLSGQGGSGEGKGTDEGDDDDGSNDGDETNALNLDDEPTGGEQGAGKENASGASDAAQGDSETDKQAEQAPVAPAAKKATSKSK